MDLLLMGDEDFDEAHHLAFMDLEPCVPAGKYFGYIHLFNDKGFPVAAEESSTLLDITDGLVHGIDVLAYQGDATYD